MSDLAKDRQPSNVPLSENRIEHGFAQIQVICSQRSSHSELTPFSQEEGSSHLLFEGANPQTDGGLGDIQFACGFAETAMKNDLVEGLQLVKIHR